MPVSWNGTASFYLSISWLFIPLHDSRLAQFCVDYRKDRGEFMVLVSHIQHLNVLLRYEDKQD